MGNEIYKWYPVSTNPRAEKKVAELLKLKGINVYLPLQKQLKQWSDRKKWVEEPLIKSYLFVNITSKQYADVLKTNGIARFIYFSGRVASMPDSQIETLKRVLATCADFEVSTRTLRKGEHVLVSAGPLMGLKGELVDIYSQKQFLVRLGETGQSLLVKVPSVFLEKIDLDYERLQERN